MLIGAAAATVKATLVVAVLVPSGTPRREMQAPHGSIEVRRAVVVRCPPVGPCPQPLPQTVARSDDGHLTAHLRAGSYQVIARLNANGNICQTRSLRLVAGQIKHLRLYCNRAAEAGP
jgi:hypothetical protein